MNGDDRRTQILQLLSQSDKPVSGASMAEKFSVSRQVIVQDIALLRANGNDIFSGKYGYLLQSPVLYSRIFKLIHSDDEVREELQIIIDLGGVVKDVFVYHKVYGVVKSEMNIKSRRDIEKYISDIQSGKSSLLKNITSSFHYHTVTAEDEQTLDIIQQKLTERGFLAKLQDYEPVDFWKKD